MFTGIVTETGIVKKISRQKTGIKLAVACERTGLSLREGDSVAVNGVCLTITEKKQGLLLFDVVKNTLERTALKRLKVGGRVNLEEAMKLGDAVSGHMVTGHVDGERRIRDNRNTSKGWIVSVEMRDDDEKYLVKGGSVSVDGVSLTVAEVNQSFFGIYLIPETFNRTVLKEKRPGYYVNIEFDMMIKNLRKLDKGGAITRDMLAQRGFI